MDEKNTLKYYMRSNDEPIVEVPAPGNRVDDNGNPLMMKVKVLSFNHIRKIENMYRKDVAALDKKNNPIIAGGKLVTKTIDDSQKRVGHVLVEAIAEPNLRDPELMSYYGVHDFCDMPAAVFSSTKEYNELVDTVFKVLGILEDEKPEDEEIEDIKN